MAASRGTASSRSQSRSIRSARSPTTSTDTALLLEAIAGHDKRDSTSVNQPVPEYGKTLNQPVKGLRIGVPREFFDQGLDSEVESAVRAAMKEYEKQGAALVDVSLPHSRYALAAYYIVAPAEASSNLARFDGMHYGHRTKEKSDLIATYAKSRGEAFGKEVQRRIMIGTYVLSSGYSEKYYRKALQVRQLVKKDYDDVFAKCEVVMGPTTPAVAFKAGAKSDDPLAMYLSDVYTVACNLAGIPGLSIPCGFTQRGSADRPATSRPALRRGETPSRRSHVRIQDRLAYEAAESVNLAFGHRCRRCSPGRGQPDATFQELDTLACSAFPASPLRRPIWFAARDSPQPIASRSSARDNLPARTPRDA